MNQPIQFGFRIPDFPLDSSRGRLFTDQIIGCMDEIHPLFDSAWEADHFIPWASSQAPTTDTLGLRNQSALV